MNYHALFASATFTAVCSGIAVGAYALYSPAVITEPDTLCPADGPPAGYALLVLDATDPWSDEQLSGLRSQIRKISAALRTGEKFAVVELPAVAPTIPKPKFAMCSPGSGADANVWTQGPKLLRDRFDKQFMAPLDLYVSSLHALHSAPTTPLLDVLSALAERDDFKAVTGRRQLWIASDMLENYLGVNHYRSDIGTYADFAKSARGRDLAADLKGVEVHILYIVNARASEFQGRKHLAWWREWVSANGGTLVSVEPL